MATAAVVVPVNTAMQSSGTGILESMNPEERAAYNKTGEIPARPQGESATSAPPATVAKSEPEETPAETKPESEPGKLVQELEKEKPASRGDKRILELLGKNKALEAELEVLRKPKVEVKAETKPESAPGKPSSPVVISDALKAKITALVGTADQFETYEDMVAALGVEIVQSMVPDLVKQVLKQEEETRQTTKAQEKLEEEWLKSCRVAKAKHVDWEPVSDTPEMARLIPNPSPLNTFLVESELGAEILYYLATHKDEIKRISALPPLAQHRAIITLETTLSGSPAPVETEEVPPPPRTLGAGPTLPPDAAAKALKDGDKDPNAFTRYRAAANEEELKKLRKG